MATFDFDKAEPYMHILRSDRYGKSAEERKAEVTSRYLGKLSALEKRKNWQFKWVMAGYFIGPIIYLIGGALGDKSSVTSIMMVAAFFMNMAAYHSGKHQFFAVAEGAAYGDALDAWEKVGKPLGYQ
jgi:hypothetical protein